MITSKVCELCKTEGELICLCKQVILCSSCVGKHIISDISSNHKPVALSENQLATLMAENWHELCATEAQILAQASQKQEIFTTIKQKLEKELSAIEEYQNLSVQFVTEIVRIIERDLLEVAEDMTLKIINQCGLAKKQISEALDLFNKGDYQYNDLANALSSCISSEEVQNFEILIKKIDFQKIDIKNIIFKQFLFEVSIRTSQVQQKPEIPPKITPRSSSTSIKQSLSPTKLLSPKASTISRIGGKRNLIHNPSIFEFGENYVSLTARESRHSDNQKHLIIQTPKSKLQRSSSTSRKKILSGMLYYLMPNMKQVISYNTSTEELTNMKLKSRDVCLEGSA